MRCPPSSVHSDEELTMLVNHGTKGRAVFERQCIDSSYFGGGVGGPNKPARTGGEAGTGDAAGG